MSYYQQIKPFVILLGIFFHITNKWNPTNILLMAFHVIIFNSMEFYDGRPSIIPSVMCLIFFKNQIQINRLEKIKKKTKIKELNKGNNIPIF